MQGGQLYFLHYVLIICAKMLQKQTGKWRLLYEQKSSGKTKMRNKKKNAKCENEKLPTHN